MVTEATQSFARTRLEQRVCHLSPHHDVTTIHISRRERGDMTVFAVAHCINKMGSTVWINSKTKRALPQLNPPPP